MAPLKRSETIIEIYSSPSPVPPPPTAAPASRHYPRTRSQGPPSPTRASTSTRSTGNASNAGQPTRKGKGALGPVIELTDSDSDDVPVRLVNAVVNTKTIGPSKAGGRGGLARQPENAVASGSGTRQQEALDTDDSEEVELVDFDPELAAKKFPFDQEFMSSQTRGNTIRESSKPIAGPSRPRGTDNALRTPAQKDFIPANDDVRLPSASSRRPTPRVLAELDELARGPTPQQNVPVAAAPPPAALIQPQTHISVDFAPVVNALPVPVVFNPPPVPHPIPAAIIPQPLTPAAALLPAPIIQPPPAAAPADEAALVELALVHMRQILPDFDADALYLEHLVRVNVPKWGAQTAERILGALMDIGKGEVAVARPAPQVFPALPPAPVEVNNVGVHDVFRPVVAQAPPPPRVVPPEPQAVPEPPPVAVPPPQNPAVALTNGVETSVSQVLEVFPMLSRVLVDQYVRQLPVEWGAETGVRMLGALMDGQLDMKKLMDDDATKGVKGKGRAVDDDAVGQGEAKRVKVDYERIDRPFEGGEHYTEIALIYMQCAFPYVPKAYLRRVLTMHNGHFAPAYIYLRSGTHPPGAGWGSWSRPALARERDLADAEGFMHGATWDSGYVPNKRPFDSRRRDGLIAHRADAVFEAERRWVEGRFGGVAAGEVGTADNAKGKGKARKEDAEDEDADIECQCCFSEYPFTQMVQCPEAHLFCTICVNTYASTQLAASSASLVCMHDSGCALPFPPTELARALTPKLMELYERILAAKAVEEAGLEGLEACPFCEWQCVMEVGGEEKLFRCGNTERCGAVSCRQCKKKDHLPKSCEEFEADKHLDGRHAIEEAMTAALMRNCPKCKKAFIKEYGCNKMTCPNCRTLSCYVCRQAIKGYDHFNQNQPGQRVAQSSKHGSKCLLWDEVEKRHADEVKAAAEAATKAYRDANPDVDAAVLKVDVPAPPPAPAPAVNNPGRVPLMGELVRRPQMGAQGGLWVHEWQLDIPVAARRGDAAQHHGAARARHAERARYEAEQAHLQAMRIRAQVEAQARAQQALADARIQNARVQEFVRLQQAEAQATIRARADAHDFVQKHRADHKERERKAREAAAREAHKEEQRNRQAAVARVRAGAQERANAVLAHVDVQVAAFEAINAQVAAMEQNLVQAMEEMRRQTRIVGGGVAGTGADRPDKPPKRPKHHPR